MGTNTTMRRTLAREPVIQNATTWAVRKLCSPWSTLAHPNSLVPPPDNLADAIMTLESAICPHLRCERILPKATPANYVPPFPVFSARFDMDMQDVAMVMNGRCH